MPSISGSPKKLCFLMTCGSERSERAKTSFEANNNNAHKISTNFHHNKEEKEKNLGF